jgi:hypothetical protein
LWSRFAAAVAVLTLTGCASVAPTTSTTYGRSIDTIDATSQSAAKTPRSPAAPYRPARRSPWGIDPDGALPAHSPWRPVLSASRRFLSAAIALETGRDRSSARRQLQVSATRQLARVLLTHPPSPPPPQLVERLVAIDPLERLDHEVLVLALIASRIGATTNLTSVRLSLVAHHGRWLVSRLDFLQ